MEHISGLKILCKKKTVKEVTGGNSSSCSVTDNRPYGKLQRNTVCVVVRVDVKQHILSTIRECTGYIVAVPVVEARGMVGSHEQGDRKIQ